MKKQFTLVCVLTLFSLLLFNDGIAQTVTIPAANTNGTGGTATNARKPYGNYFGFERSAMIYSAAEIGTTGTINTVGFYVNSINAPGASTPVQIYMKQTAANTFAAASTVATELTGATLVYSGNITSAMLVAGNWTTVTLSTPFNYTGGTNLEIIILTNAGGLGNEGTTGKQFRYSNSSAPNYYFQYWQADNTAPAGNGTLNFYRPNIQLNFVVPIDLSITSLAAPIQAGCFGPNQNVNVNLRNNGSSTIDFSVTPATISCSVTGPNPQTFTSVVLNSGTLVPGASQVVPISTTYDMSLSGTYTFNSSVSIAGDGNAANDAMAPANIAVSRVNTFPHIEGFSSIPNPAFLVQQVTGTGNWGVVTTGNMTNPTLAPALNPGFAFFNSYNFANGTSSRLITPCYDMTSLNNPAIDVWMSQDNVYPGNNDRVDIIVSTDGGATWNSSLQTLARYNATYTTPGWKKFTIPLTGYNNNPNVRIALLATSTYGNNIGVDQLTVYNLPAVDIQPLTLVNPTSNSCHTNNENISVNIINNGISTVDFSVTPLTITVNVTGASTQNFSTTINTGTLGPNASSIFAVATGCNLTAQGTHTFTTTTSISGDGNTTNDVLASNVAVGDISTFPSLENFDGTRLGWNINQLSGTGNWSYSAGNMANPTLAPYSGGFTAYFNSYTFTSGTSSRLSSPCIDLNGLSNPTLEFYMSQDAAYSANNDRVEVRISTDGGATYSPVVLTASRYAPGATGWKKFTYCLSAYTNMSNIKIAFDAISAYGNNFAIENVSIRTSAPAVAGTITPVGNPICANQTITMNLLGNTGAIQWQSSSDNSTFTSISGATSASYTSGTLTSDTYYRVRITNSDACAVVLDGPSTLITVNPLPIVNLGSAITQCGGTATLDAGNAGASYLWNDNSTAQTLVASTSGNYSVTVTDANTCSANGSISVTINPIPVVNLGSAITQCGGTATLDAGNAGASYLWNDNSTSQTLVANTSGNYSVAVTDANSCVGNGSINVTINPIPVVNLGNDITQCGGTATLDAGNAGASYLWNDNSTTQTLLVSSTGSYDVTVTDANTCVGNGSINITINPLPVVNLGSNITQCGGTATLDAGNTGATYLWNDNSTAQTLVASSTGTYDVTVTDANACSANGSIFVTINPIPIINLGSDITQCAGSVTLDAGNAGANFLWNDNSTAQTLLVTSTGTYDVTVTDGNSCSNTASINITINSLPIVNLGSDITQCGGMVTLDAGNTGASYLWNDNSTAQTLDVFTTGTYDVTVTDANNCSANGSINITITPGPVVNLGSAITQCGGTVTLDAGNAGSTYLWNDNSTNQTLVVSTSGTYDVTVTDGNNCSVNGSINVTINSNPVVNLGADITQCGGTVTLDAGNAGASYLWNDNSSNQTLVVSTSGSYDVIVTDANNCSSNASINVTINALPTVSFLINQNLFCNNDVAYTLTEGSPSGGVYSGAGVSGGIFDPAVAGVGSHVITYTFTDGNGCSNSDVQTVMVNFCTDVTTLADAFGFSIYPNPSKGNFTLDLKGLQSDKFNIEIIDPLGKVILSEGKLTNTTSTALQYSLDAVVNGIYFVRLTSGNETLVKRLVINK